jgi:hypothetical protein
MAFSVFSFRLPDEYYEAIRDIAGKEDESIGFVLQQAIYNMLNGRLPVPRRRDRNPSGKTGEIKLGEKK